MSFHNHDEDIIKRLNQQTEADRKAKKDAIAQGGARGGSKWRRYRFETKSVDDYRPLVFNPKYPWWCSGYGLGGNATDGYPESQTAVIVAYLPPNEDLKKYWDDAFNIEFEEKAEIEFSGRFPKPSYFVEG